MLRPPRRLHFPRKQSEVSLHAASQRGLFGGERPAARLSVISCYFPLVKRAVLWFTLPGAWLCEDMTHGVVQSDIEFAERLLKAASQDSDVVSALCCRGVTAEEAAQLVNEIHRGQGVHCPLPTECQAVWPHNLGTDTAPGDTPRPLRIRRRQYGQGELKRDGAEWGKVFIAVILSVCCIGYVTYWCMVRTHEPVGRGNEHVPFVQTDDFAKDAQALTNTAGH